MAPRCLERRSDSLFWIIKSFIMEHTEEPELSRCVHCFSCEPTSCPPQTRVHSKGGPSLSSVADQGCEGPGSGIKEHLTFNKLLRNSETRLWVPKRLWNLASGFSCPVNADTVVTLGPWPRSHAYTEHRSDRRPQIPKTKIKATAWEAFIINYFRCK